MTGRDQKGVPALHIPTCTNAQDTGQRIMELRNAFKARTSKVLNPYHPEVWWQLLNSSNLIHKYAHIPNGLHIGFMGSVPTISHTYILPNSPLLHTYSNTFNTILEHEYSTGRFIGPLSRTEMEELIGP